MELKGLKINFLGDSITEGVGASSKDTIYHAVLAKEAGLAQARNYGISGTRFAVQKGIFNTQKDNCVETNSFCERFDGMDDADAVVVFGGTNDYGHGDAPLGCFEDRAPDTFYGACHYLFSGLIRKYLGKPIVIMTPLHRIDELKIPDIKKQGKGYGNLKVYTDIIREVAEFYSLPVLDLFSVSGMQPEIKEIQEEYIPDGLHPNDNGHAVIARKLRLFLESI